MTKPRKETLEVLEELRDRFHYKDGKLFASKAYCQSVKIGQEVGHNNGRGYLRVKVKGKQYRLHRVIYFLETGIWPRDQIDHIDGNKLNNKIENLREVSNLENTRSYKKKKVNATSKYRGVSWCKFRSKWAAQIRADGVDKNLGRFNSETDAALAYNEAAMVNGFNKEALNVITIIN